MRKVTMSISIQRCIFIIIISVLLFTVGCRDHSDSLTNNTIRNEPIPINLRMPIPSLESHAVPFVVADELGFYAEEGLEVTIQPGTSELNPVNAIISGASDIAYLGGPDTLLTAIGKGVPLIAVANLHQQSDFIGVMSMKNSGITRLEDLDGKRLGLFYGHISTDILRPVLKEVGVEVTEVDTKYDLNQLVTGKVDAMFAFRTYNPLILKDKMGYDSNYIDLGDYGVHSYGYTIFTSEDYLEEHPEIVRKFLRATMKGVQWSVAHEKEAAALLVEVNPELTLSFEEKVLGLVNTIYKEQYQDGKVLGYMDDEMFSTTYDRIANQGLIQQPFDFRDAYITDFLPSDLRLVSS